MFDYGEKETFASIYLAFTSHLRFVNDKWILAKVQETSKS